MADVKANVGKILLGAKELAYCEGIEIDYDYNPIKHFAGDRQYPIYVGHGNSEMSISIDCAEYKADDEYAFETIANSGVAVTVTLQAGDRGGGIPAAIFTNCVVVHYTVTSRQGDVVKAKVILSKQADS